MKKNSYPDTMFLRVSKFIALQPKLVKEIKIAQHRARTFQSRFTHLYLTISRNTEEQ